MSEALKQYLWQYSLQDGIKAAWLLERKNAAIETVKEQGFPTRKLEEWKYTDVRPLTERDFSFTDEAPYSIDNAAVTAARIADLDCHELVFVNGRYAPEFSHHGDLAGGVAIKPLRQALAEDEALLKQHLTRHADASKNGFAALNTAFIQDGAVIAVPDGVELDKPVNVIYLVNTPSKVFGWNPRNLIVLGRQARATVIETYYGTDGTEYFTNAITEASVGEAACLEHYKLQQESPDAFHIGNLQANIKRDGRFVSHAISLGGRLVRTDIDVKLPEPGAEAVLNGLYVAGAGQHVDHHTRLDHIAPRTTSRETYRGVLTGKARGVFNGKIVVHEGAQKTDAQLSNANLLLSNDAEVDTKPELEIYADDVKCAHGATVGRLDENMLYYLRTRAIPAEVAKSLLTFAFAEDVITRIGLAPLRERLGKAVVGRLPDADLIREFTR